MKYKPAKLVKNEKNSCFAVRMEWVKHDVSSMGARELHYTYYIYTCYNNNSINNNNNNISLPLV